MINKKLVYTLRILEVVIQSILFLSITVTLYYIAVGKESLGVLHCMLVILPVAATYLARKFIHKFVAFVVCNLALLVGALFLGTTDSEHFFYFVIAALVVFYSIRLKMIIVQKGDISEIPLYDNEMDAVEKEKTMESMQSSEKQPVQFFVFMIVGYMLCHAADSTTAMEAQVVLFVLYVLFQILYNDLSRLNTLYIRNADKSEFPAKQIRSVNTFIIAGTIILMLAGMIVFYNGKYGSSFTIIGSGLLGILRAVLKFLVFLAGKSSNKQPSVIEETTEAQTDASTQLETETLQDNQLAQSISEVFAMLLITAAVIGLTYMLIAYIKHFNRARRFGSDYVESVKDEAKRKKEVIPRGNRKSKDFKAGKNNSYARKLYKQKVLEGCEKDVKPDPTKTPDALTREAITRNPAQADQITDIYEKARYSNEKVTKEEIDVLKNTKKNL